MHVIYLWTVLAILKSICHGTEYNASIIDPNTSGSMGIFILVALSEILRPSYASITGVTYMDNFDFEQRYRNINECNPFYWHPLHMPDDCAEMFGKAIRSRIKSNLPIRLARERKTEIIEIPSPYGISSSYGVEVFQAPIRTEISYYGHPFGKMLELLSRDVEDHPRAPTVGLLPNIGLVALYQQPISRQTKKMIKKVAGVYAPHGAYNEPMYPLSSINVTYYGDNSTERSEIVKIKKTKKKNRTVTKKKINKGNVLAILKESE